MATIEEIIQSIVEDENTDINTSSQDDTQDQDQQVVGQDEDQESEEDKKQRLLDNINRLIIVKDILMELNNYKQDEEIAELLNKTRLLLIDISRQVKAESYDNLVAVNNGIEQLLKMIIVYIKQKVDPKFRKQYTDKVSNLQQTERE